MRQQNSNNSNRRPRGRSNNNNRKPQQSRNGVFDSNGPGGRIRGNASQLKEKYLQMARDAAVGGDRVAAESYYQFAEHYFRVINDSTDPNSGQRNNQSDSYRNRNQRSAPDADTKPVDGNVTESESDAQPAIVLQDEAVETEVENKKPIPRNRVRSRRPRYEASDAPEATETVGEAQPSVDSVDPKPVKADEAPAVVELPLSTEEAPAEKPKRRPRTPKAASAEPKTPRPRGRPRKTPVVKDTTETA